MAKKKEGSHNNKKEIKKGNFETNDHSLAHTFSLFTKSFTKSVFTNVDSSL